MTSSKNWSYTLLIVAFALPLSAAEKEEDPSRLSVERIFSSGEFSSESFPARWLPDGSGYVCLERSDDPSGGRDLVRHDAETDQREILVSAAHLVPPGESKPLRIDDYAFSQDRSLLLIYTNSKRVWRQNTRGDYWVLDRAGRELRKLGGDAPPSTLMFAKFSPTGRHVAYVRQGNIYLEDLRDHGIRALTRSESLEVINGTFDWVYEEELSLRDGFRFSPDGESIAYWQLDTRGVPGFVMVNNTDVLYPRLTEFKYPKVGQQNSACRVGVVALADGKTRWLDVPGCPREHYIARMDWAGPGRIILQQLNRRQNTNRVMLADAETLQATTILTETDDAWVDVHDELTWLADGQRFTWLSDRDGWRHVYLASRTGEAPRLATPGDYDVIRLLHVDEPGGWLYYLASPENPTQRYLYRVRLDGTGTQHVTPSGQPGTHDYQIAPHGRWAIHRFSSFDSPPTAELVELPDHKTVRPLAENKSLREKLDKLWRRPAEFLRIDVGDGVLLDAWCIQPPDLDPGKKYPLLVYVYGEPAGQTVVDRWGGNGYLWHLMLAQRGYVVMSIDNRGTHAPRGRAWRKCIYRQVGILAPADQAAAIRKVLSERSYLDPERIGVWGWSGGGSMSLNAIFKYPNLYRTAMAVAPVANQRLYDTIYQERYMGLPGDNDEGYRRGSPVNFASQLEGNLLIVHGTGDDNCHYQATETLINELIRCNKRFTMMAYPNRSHSIREGVNTTLHLRNLLTRYLQENLPPGPRPAE
ncbi:MAG: S9 family peptidase [Pirellulales bacterium]|nr:S9 family peptidase [Pirellulales bacterium]